MRFLNSTNKSKQSAFTMAEAILVMTILGVIASVMITTLKPAEFKEKALKLLAKKTIYQIDSATMQIISNNSADGTMENLFLTSDTDKFSFNDDFSKTLLLYQKYLATTRKEFDIDNTTDFFKQIIQSSSNANSQASPIYLKDGSLIFLGAGEKYGVSPDATGTINVEGCEMTKALYGLIAIDTNGDDEPNTIYQDQFYLPIGKTGVDWEQVCNLQSGDVVATTPTITPEPSEIEETETPEVNEEENDPIGLCDCDIAAYPEASCSGQVYYGHECHPEDTYVKSSECSGIGSCIDSAFTCDGVTYLSYKVVCVHVPSL